MKNYLYSLIIAFAIASSLGAQSIFNGYAYVSGTGAGNSPTWYNLSGNAQSSSFQGSDLGDFTTGLWLGGQTGFWANGSGTQFVTLNYSITGAATANGSVSYSFQYFEGPAGSNNDQWGTDISGSNTTEGSVDIIAANSLGAGDYNIAVWVEGKANNGTSAFDSNSSNNYNATFTVIPESSTLALVAGFGCLLYVMLKRRLI